MKIKLKTVIFLMIILPLDKISYLHPETIRDRAVTHFNRIDWSLKENTVPFVEKPGKPLPGGNETFPVLDIDTGKQTAAIYPEIERLGFLEYAGIETSLIDFMNTVTGQLKENKIDESLCNPAFPFLSSICNYQMEKLSSPEDIFFSRPIEDMSEQFNSVFRLQFIEESRSTSVFMTIGVKKFENNWKINEIIFDGDSYAAQTQPN